MGVACWKVIASRKVVGASRQRAAPRIQSTRRRAGARCSAQRQRSFWSNGANFCKPGQRFSSFKAARKQRTHILHSLHFSTLRRSRNLQSLPLSTTLKNARSTQISVVSNRHSFAIAIHALLANLALNRTYCGGPAFGLQKPSPNTSPPQ